MPKLIDSYPALRVKNLHKSNRSGNGEIIDILCELNLAVQAGETVAITGYSGSGKTTLLSLLAGLDSADSGMIEIFGDDITTRNEQGLTRFRAKNIGIIFQQFYLMQHLSALENTALPLEILNRSNSQSQARAMLDKVGLSQRAGHLPNELSGGEIQRIAIARALIINPKILFADEPTGNLDAENATNITNLLFSLVAEQSMTLVLVTHNMELANRCQHIYQLNKGQLYKF